MIKAKGHALSRANPPGYEFITFLLSNIEVRKHSFKNLF